MANLKILKTAEATMNVDGEDFQFPMVEEMSCDPEYDARVFAPHSIAWKAKPLIRMGSGMPLRERHSTGAAGFLVKAYGVITKLWFRYRMWIDNKLDQIWEFGEYKLTRARIHRRRSRLIGLSTNVSLAATRENSWPRIALATSFPLTGLPASRVPRR